ncbi:TRAP transporter 4TM/12TM fusion protein [Roseibium hamelinense]|uniref:TRAP transporter 4TM/12TM fusion protein n=1 Tax=Roseibium hamelinense TaxID=150831 RepID=A0A562SY41_9HYPH|nr:TRAP transporter fused permease subunit [Roseibium hamelinense]MTI44760.1 TRAP transporter fused permease subunit [Roseibium hamelinense]TWI86053.1 TRAP transporter 4TM/12TM fusion protein [Roseibium hamelinense]
MTSTTTSEQEYEHLIAQGVDEEPVEQNRRLFTGTSLAVMSAVAAFYAAFHMAALNGLSIYELTGIRVPFLPAFPMETWNFRIVHVAGALVLGFLMFGPRLSFPEKGQETPVLGYAAYVLMLPALFALGMAFSFAVEINNGLMWNGIDERIRFNEVYLFGLPLIVATAGGIVLSWFHQRERSGFSAPDVVLCVCAVAVAAYLITIYGTLMRNSTGTPFAPIGISIAAVAGTALIMELTRRVAGMALVVIAGFFLVYVFVGDQLPGFLNSPDISWERFFSQVYTDAGILGPTTAVSSTYIILFIIFAAFLQASKVGDYFVNFAFAAAGRARGGPAKVAIFASGLMGMINGTSAGNVVSTGSLTIPLMKKVGYHRKTAGAVEAAASTGGQIMPPIMGAGAFIMAEITGIPYTEITVAAIIPAVLYFVSVYFMVDFEAAKLGMRGMRNDELPKLGRMAKQAYLFVPIFILIAALFMGYSVIRAGALATVSAVVVSWALPEYFALRGGVRWTLQRLLVLAVSAVLVSLLVLYLVSPAPEPGADPSAALSALSLIATVLVILTFAYISFRELTGGAEAGVGLKGTFKAFELAGHMSVQIIAVCACAGIIVGVISLTGVGARFSSLLLNLADTSQLLALFFAMCISILLGMGMPTTAAYAVAASVVAPGLVQLGIPLLTAHFFVFYFAVLSAITPPVALASYAAAGISGANPMETSVTSFKIGIAAFIVPFMFFYNSAILMDGTVIEIVRAAATAIVGVFLLSSGVQGWFLGKSAVWFLRLGLIASALFMIEGGLLSDAIGLGLAAAVFAVQRFLHPKPGATVPVRGAD